MKFGKSKTPVGSHRGSKPQRKRQKAIATNRSPLHIITATPHLLSSHTSSRHTSQEADSIHHNHHEQHANPLQNDEYKIKMSDNNNVEKDHHQYQHQYHHIHHNHFKAHPIIHLTRALQHIHQRLQHFIDLSRQDDNNNNDNKNGNDSIQQHHTSSRNHIKAQIKSSLLQHMYKFPTFIHFVTFPFNNNNDNNHNNHMNDNQSKASLRHKKQKSTTLLSELLVIAPESVVSTPTTTTTTSSITTPTTRHHHSITITPTNTNPHELYHQLQTAITTYVSRMLQVTLNQQQKQQRQQQQQNNHPSTTTSKSSSLTTLHNNQSHHHDDHNYNYNHHHQYHHHITPKQLFSTAFRQTTTTFFAKERSSVPKYWFDRQAQEKDWRRAHPALGARRRGYDIAGEEGDDARQEKRLKKLEKAKKYNLQQQQREQQEYGLRPADTGDSYSLHHSGAGGRRHKPSGAEIEAWFGPPPLPTMDLSGKRTNEELLIEDGRKQEEYRILARWWWKNHKRFPPHVPKPQTLSDLPKLENYELYMTQVRNIQQYLHFFPELDEAELVEYLHVTPHAAMGIRLNVLVNSLPPQDLIANDVNLAINTWALRNLASGATYMELFDQNGNITFDIYDHFILKNPLYPAKYPHLDDKIQEEQARMRRNYGQLMQELSNASINAQKRGRTYYYQWLREIRTNPLQYKLCYKFSLWNIDLVKRYEQKMKLGELEYDGAGYKYLVPNVWRILGFEPFIHGVNEFKDLFRPLPPILLNKIPDALKIDHKKIKEIDDYISKEERLTFISPAPRPGETVGDYRIRRHKELQEEKQRRILFEFGGAENLTKLNFKQKKLDDNDENNDQNNNNDNEEYDENDDKLTPEEIKRFKLLGINIDAFERDKKKFEEEKKINEKKQQLLATKTTTPSSPSSSSSTSTTTTATKVKTKNKDNNENDLVVGESSSSIDDDDNISDDKKQERILKKALQYIESTTDSSVNDLDDLGNYDSFDDDDDDDDDSDDNVDNNNNNNDDKLERLLKKADKKKRIKNKNKKSNEGVIQQEDPYGTVDLKDFKGRWAEKTDYSENSQDNVDYYRDLAREQRLKQSKIPILEEIKQQYHNKPIPYRDIDILLYQIDEAMGLSPGTLAVKHRLEQREERTQRLKDKLNQVRDLLLKQEIAAQRKEKQRQELFDSIINNKKDKNNDKDNNKKDIIIKSSNPFSYEQLLNPYKKPLPLSSFTKPIEQQHIKFIKPYVNIATNAFASLAANVGNRYLAMLHRLKKEILLSANKNELMTIEQIKQRVLYMEELKANNIESFFSNRFIKALYPSFQIDPSILNDPRDPKYVRPLQVKMLKRKKDEDITAFAEELLKVTLLLQRETQFLWNRRPFIGLNEEAYQKAKSVSIYAVPPRAFYDTKKCLELPAGYEFAIWGAGQRDERVEQFYQEQREKKQQLLPNTKYLENTNNNNLLLNNNNDNNNNNTDQSLLTDHDKKRLELLTKPKPYDFTQPTLLNEDKNNYNNKNKNIKFRYDLLLNPRTSAKISTRLKKRPTAIASYLKKFGDYYHKERFVAIDSSARWQRKRLDDPYDPIDYGTQESTDDYFPILRIKKRKIISRENKEKESLLKRKQREKQKKLLIRQKQKEQNFVQNDMKKRKLYKQIDVTTDNDEDLFAAALLTQHTSDLTTEDFEEWGNDKKDENDDDDEFVDKRKKAKEEEEARKKKELEDMWKRPSLLQTKSNKKEKKDADKNKNDQDDEKVLEKKLRKNEKNYLTVLRDTIEAETQFRYGLERLKRRAKTDGGINLQHLLKFVKKHKKLTNLDNTLKKPLLTITTTKDSNNNDQQSNTNNSKKPKSRLLHALSSARARTKRLTNNSGMLNVLDDNNNNFNSEQNTEDQEDEEYIERRTFINQFKIANHDVISEKDEDLAEQIFDGSFKFIYNPKKPPPGVPRDIYRFDRTGQAEFLLGDGGLTNEQRFNEQLQRSGGFNNTTPVTLLMNNNIKDENEKITTNNKINNHNNNNNNNNNKLTQTFGKIKKYVPYNHKTQISRQRLEKKKKYAEECAVKFEQGTALWLKEVGDYLGNPTVKFQYDASLYYNHQTPPAEFYDFIFEHNRNFQTRKILSTCDELPPDTRIPSINKNLYKAFFRVQRQPYRAAWQSNYSDPYELNEDMLDRLYLMYDNDIISNMFNEYCFIAQNLRKLAGVEPYERKPAPIPDGTQPFYTKVHQEQYKRQRAARDKYKHDMQKQERAAKREAKQQQQQEDLNFYAFSTDPEVSDYGTKSSSNRRVKARAAARGNRPNFRREARQIFWDSKAHKDDMSQETDDDDLGHNHFDDFNHDRLPLTLIPKMQLNNDEDVLDKRGGGGGDDDDGLKTKKTDLREKYAFMSPEEREIAIAQDTEKNYWSVVQNKRLNKTTKHGDSALNDIDALSTPALPSSEKQQQPPPSVQDDDINYMNPGEIQELFQNKYGITVESAADVEKQQKRQVDVVIDAEVAKTKKKSSSSTTASAATTGSTTKPTKPSPEAVVIDEAAEELKAAEARKNRRILEIKARREEQEKDAKAKMEQLLTTQQRLTEEKYKEEQRKILEARARAVLPQALTSTTVGTAAPRLPPPTEPIHPDKNTPVPGNEVGEEWAQRIRTLHREVQAAERKNRAEKSKDSFVSETFERDLVLTSDEENTSPYQTWVPDYVEYELKQTAGGAAGSNKTTKKSKLGKEGGGDEDEDDDDDAFQNDAKWAQKMSKITSRKPKLKKGHAYLDDSGLGDSDEVSDSTTKTLLNPKRKNKNATTTSADQNDKDNKANAADQNGNNGGDSGSDSDNDDDGDNNNNNNEPSQKTGVSALDALKIQKKHNKQLEKTQAKNPTPADQELKHAIDRITKLTPEASVLLNEDNPLDALKKLKHLEAGMHDFGEDDYNEVLADIATARSRRDVGEAFALHKKATGSSTIAQYHPEHFDLEFASEDERALAERIQLANMRKKEMKKLSLDERQVAMSAMAPGVGEKQPEPLNVRTRLRVKEKPLPDVIGLLTENDDGVGDDGEEEAEKEQELSTPQQQKQPRQSRVKSPTITPIKTKAKPRKAEEDKTTESIASGDDADDESSDDDSSDNDSDDTPRRPGGGGRSGNRGGGGGSNDPTPRGAGGRVRRTAGGVVRKSLLHEAKQKQLAAERFRTMVINDPDLLDDDTDNDLYVVRHDKRKQLDNDNDVENIVDNDDDDVDVDVDVDVDTDQTRNTEDELADRGLKHYKHDMAKEAARQAYIEEHGDDVGFNPALDHLKATDPLLNREPKLDVETLLDTGEYLDHLPYKTKKDLQFSLRDYLTNRGGYAFNEDARTYAVDPEPIPTTPVDPRVDENDVTTEDEDLGQAMGKVLKKHNSLLPRFHNDFETTVRHDVGLNDDEANQYDFIIPGTNVRQYRYSTLHRRSKSLFRNLEAQHIRKNLDGRGDVQTEHLFMNKSNYNHGMLRPDQAALKPLLEEEVRKQQLRQFEYHEKHLQYVRGYFQPYGMDLREYMNPMMTLDAPKILPEYQDWFAPVLPEHAFGSQLTAKVNSAYQATVPPTKPAPRSLSLSEDALRYTNLDPEAFSHKIKRTLFEVANPDILIDKTAWFNTASHPMYYELEDPKRKAARKRHTGVKELEVGSPDANDFFETSDGNDEQNKTTDNNSTTKNTRDIIQPPPIIDLKSRVEMMAAKVKRDGLRTYAHEDDDDEDDSKNDTDLKPIEAQPKMPKANEPLTPQQQLKQKLEQMASVAKHLAQRDTSDLDVVQRAMFEQSPEFAKYYKQLQKIEDINDTYHPTEKIRVASSHAVQQQQQREFERLQQIQREMDEDMSMYPQSRHLSKTIHNHNNNEESLATKIAKDPLIRLKYGQLLQNVVGTTAHPKELDVSAKLKLKLQQLQEGNNSIDAKKISAMLNSNKDSNNNTTTTSSEEQHTKTLTAAEYQAASSVHNVLANIRLQQQQLEQNRKNNIMNDDDVDQYTNPQLTSPLDSLRSAPRTRPTSTSPPKFSSFNPDKPQRGPPRM